MRPTPASFSPLGRAGEDAPKRIGEKEQGGNISYNPTKDEYLYNSSSYGSARDIISYFDYYHLLSNKHINYLKWSKAYIIIQNKDHLSENGLNKIIKLKSTMNSLNNTTNSLR